MPIHPPVLAEAAILGPTTELTRRVEIYEANATTRWKNGTQDSRLINGTVTIDQGRDERRSFDLELDNTDFGLEHKPGGFWYDKILKIYSGVRYWDGSAWQNWECQIGEFMIDSITEAHFPHTVRVAGRDMTKKMLLSKCINAYSFNKTTRVDVAVRQQVQIAGIVKYVIPVDNTQVGRDYSWERGTSRWEIAKEIAEAFGYEIYFDASGYFVMRPFQDPITAPISYTFETGKYGNLISYEKSVNDSRLFNHIVITGESSDSDVQPVSADAQNNNAMSPTRISLIGDRPYFYSSSFITTTSQAQKLANNWLKIYSMEEYDINLESIAAPWLEAGDIIEFLDPRPAIGQPTQFLLSSVSLPLGIGGMSANAKRITVVD